MSTEEQQQIDLETLLETVRENRARHIVPGSEQEANWHYLVPKPMWRQPKQKKEKP